MVYQMIIVEYQPALDSIVKQHVPISGLTAPLGNMSLRASIFFYTFSQCIYTCGAAATYHQDNIGYIRYHSKKRTQSSIKYLPWQFIKKQQPVFAPNSLQIPLRGPLFCPILKWDWTCNGSRFPMILRWRPVLKWDGASNGPRSHSRFAENSGKI